MSKATSTYWRNMAMKARQDAKELREQGYRRLAIDNLKFARWCMKMSRQFA